MLCHFQDAFQDFSSKHLYNDHDSPLTELRPPSACFEQCLHAESLSDQQVWDIVARWKGPRPLQDLYLNLAVHSKYTTSLCVMGSSNPEEMEMLNILGLARHGKEIRYNNGGISTTRAFSPTETGRFYKALTACWVAIEIRKLALQCRYTLQSNQNKTFEAVYSIWEERTDLQESLDVLEVFDFVYGFLCQHIDGVDVDSFTDWVDDNWLMEGELLRSERSFFMKNLWVALDPPDVLELLHRTSLWKEQAGSHAQTWSQEMRRDYLRLRGFFGGNLLEGVMVIDVGETPDTWYSTPVLEWACKLQFQKMVGNRRSEAAAAWKNYRTILWQTDARGRFGERQNIRFLNS